MIGPYYSLEQSETLTRVLFRNSDLQASTVLLMAVEQQEDGGVKVTHVRPYGEVVNRGGTNLLDTEYWSALPQVPH